MQQLKFELIKMFARKRSYIGYVVFLVFQVGILAMLRLPQAQEAMAWVLTRNGFPVEPFYGGLTLGVVIIMFTFAMLAALYLALVGGDIVAKEVEDGTMRLILARPISRTRLILVKWAACSIYTATLMLFLAATALATATAYSGGLGQLFVYAPFNYVFGIFDTGDGLVRLVVAVAMLTATTQTVSNLALMFSCMPVKPAAATVLALSVLYIDQALQSIPYFESYREQFISNHLICWIRVFNDPLPVWDLLASLAFLGGLNVSFVVIGVLVFSVRDLKS